MLHELASLTTAHIADACIRIGATVRCAPSNVRPVASRMKFAGPAQPVRHTGSVDIILEATGQMAPGAVLVVDDDARTDRACIGDLVVLEAHHAGAAGLVVNGLHRDTDDLIEIDLPVFSMGSCPTGPLEWGPGPADALTRCQLGEWTVTGDDYVIGDRDGVIIVATAQLEDLVRAATAIRDRERAQAERARAGTSLREQFDFDDYLAQRRTNPGFTFRQHLARRSASIEE